jgi:hypothetical protein
MNDQPRFLSKSGLGYVSSPIVALPGEPEAVSRDDQDALTERAHQTAKDRRRTELERMLADAQRKRDHLTALARHAERAAAKLERKCRGA